MGKKIRSFFVCFIILVLFSGTLFFIGWTQFRVKADTAGVLVSKTGGVNENVIEGGEFSWHWEFLLPTNAQLRLFSTKPVMVEKRISGELPSGSVYAGLYKNSPDFSYNFDFLISAAVSKDSLPSLVKDGSLTDQNSLEKYINYAADDFIRSAVQKLISLPVSLPCSFQKRLIMMHFSRILPFHQNIRALKSGLFQCGTSVFRTANCIRKRATYTCSRRCLLSLRMTVQVRKISPVLQPAADSL